MKRLFINLMAILACASVSFSLVGCKGGSDLIYANSHDGFLNIRLEPSAKSSIIGRMYNGDEGAKDLGIVAGDWMQVEQRGVTGWVHLNYVQSVPSSPMLMNDKNLVGVWYAKNGMGSGSFQTLLFFDDGTYAEADMLGDLNGAGRWTLLEGKLELKQSYDMYKREKSKALKELTIVREYTTKMLLDIENDVVYRKDRFISDAATQWDSYKGKWSKTLYDCAHGEVATFVK